MRYATRSVVEGGDANAGSSEVKVWDEEVGDVYVAAREGILGDGVRVLFFGMLQMRVVLNW